MEVQRQIDQLLVQRAAEWFEVLQTGDASDRAAFVAWLRQSKLHVEKFLEIVALDKELQLLRPALEEDVDALLQRIAPHAAEQGRFNARHIPRQRVWRTTYIALAAGVLLGIAGLIAWRMQLQTQAVGYATALGEQRTFTLADGSVVTLNVGSTSRVRFSNDARRIELTRGEAIFKVARESARPFVVRAGRAQVEVVGTQFNVKRETDAGSVISVLEGRVRLSPNESLAAGEQADVKPDGSVEKRPHADVQRAVAWRQRRLIFEDTPLEDIVREFRRYEPSLRIRTEGIAPGSYQYGGIFDADDPSSLMDLLSREPDLVVEQENGEIVIRKK